MKIIAYHDNRSFTLGNFPNVPVPTVEAILYLPNGEAVIVKEVRYHFDESSLITVHCNYN